MASRRYFLLLVALFLCLSCAVPLAAAATPSDSGAQTQLAPSNNPQTVSLIPNNKVGINVIRYLDGRYLKAASQVVNSSGGDWGYVTIVLASGDRQNPAWVQRFLDEANFYHLIPILRLATRYEGDVWVKPAPNEAAEWKKFLTGLKWYTSATYLVVGNEPNLGLEWGGDVNPREYAQYLKSFLDAFSDVRDRFKILNGPMDLSNLTKPGMMDEFEFLTAMKAEAPDLFSRLDGWASNPYHFFEGRGLRYTYRGYSVELDFLGVDLPVFITESYIGFADDPEKVGQYYETAFNYWLKDPRVVAATPHFYNPEAKVFWMYDADASGNVINLSPTASRIMAIPKVCGSPTFVAIRPAPMKVSGSASLEPLANPKLDYDIPNGHFFTQTNGSAPGASTHGFSLTDEAGIPFWSEFKRLGGVDALGYPAFRRFLFDGFVTQATQKFLLQWRPDKQEVWFVNVFDVLFERGKDPWLYDARQTPRHPGSAADAGLTWEAIQQRHWQLLGGDAAIKALFEADKDPLSHYGLPIAMADMGNSIVLRAQRAVFQKWKEQVPWAPAGYITVANGGDIAKEAGLVPLEAMVIEQPPSQ